jgi:hypothetical protein
VLWVELPPTVDGLELYARALDAGVSVVPGQMFSPHGGYQHFVRLSCAHVWNDRIRRAVEMVGRLATEAGAAASGRPAWVALAVGLVAWAFALGYVGSASWTATRPALAMVVLLVPVVVVHASLTLLVRRRGRGPVREGGKRSPTG